MFFMISRLFFEGDEQFDFQLELESLINNLSKRIKGLIKYRQENAHGFETYLSFIFEDQFVITEFTEGALHNLETIDVRASEHFMEINDIMFPPLFY